VSEIQPWQNPQTDPRPAAKIVKGILEPNARHWLRAWWPALLWAVFIFVMSTDTFSSEHTAWFFEPVIRRLVPSLTAAQVDLVHHYIRKSAHFTEYFVFCTLLYRGIRGARAGWRWTWALTALFIAVGYSVLDEIHQAFVASRQASPYDSLLDSVGAFFAFGVIWLWFRLRDPQRAAPSQA
jgi:VanZ family protein